MAKAFIYWLFTLHCGLAQLQIRAMLKSLQLHEWPIPADFPLKRNNPIVKVEESILDRVELTIGSR